MCATGDLVVVGVVGAIVGSVVTRVFIFRALDRTLQQTRALIAKIERGEV
jgi:uncharacterized membrane protein YeaQ/YmgE (transglycosylase-associated protein family)